MDSNKKPKKRKRNVLNLNQKLEIIDRLEKGEHRHILIKEFNIGSSTLYDIKHNKNELHKFASKTETTQGLEKRKTLHKPKMEKIDTLVYDWFTEKKKEGLWVSGTMLIEKAKEFYKELNVTEPCLFSDGWLSCFKLRHGIQKFGSLKDNFQQPSASLSSNTNFQLEINEIKLEPLEMNNEELYLPGTQYDQFPLENTSNNSDDYNTLLHEPDTQLYEYDQTLSQSINHEKSDSEDEFDIFGQHIAAKLRSLRPGSAMKAQRDINYFITQIKTPHGGKRFINVNEENYSDRETSSGNCSKNGAKKRKKKRMDEEIQRNEEAGTFGKLIAVHLCKMPPNVALEMQAKLLFYITKTREKCL